jgi:hypothetical protein
MRVRDMERFLFFVFCPSFCEYIFSLFSSLLKNCIFWDPQKFSKKKNNYSRVGFRVLDSSKKLSRLFVSTVVIFILCLACTTRSKRCRRVRRSTRSGETRASSTRRSRRRRQKYIAKDRCRRTTRKALVVVRIESMAMRFSPPLED